MPKKKYNNNIIELHNIILSNSIFLSFCHKIAFKKEND